MHDVSDVVLGGLLVIIIFVVYVASGRDNKKNKDRGFDISDLLD